LNGGGVFKRSFGGGNEKARKDGRFLGQGLKKGGG